MNYPLRSILFLTVLLLSGLSLRLTAEEQKVENFWVPAPGTTNQKNWTIYKPASKELQEHGFLIRTTLTETERPLEAKNILAQLFLEFGTELRILGQKKVDMNGRPGLLMSFQVVIDKSQVMGRAVICDMPTGAEVFLLLRRPVSSRKLKTYFDEVWQNWAQSQPAPTVDADTED